MKIFPGLLHHYDDKKFFKNFARFITSSWLHKNSWNFFLKFSRHVPIELEKFVKNRPKVNFARSFFFIVLTPSSQPLMTCPSPRVNVNSPRPREESNWVLLEGFLRTTKIFRNFFERSNQKLADWCQVSNFTPNKQSIMIGLQ